MNVNELKYKTTTLKEEIKLLKEKLKETATKLLEFHKSLNLSKLNTR